MITQEHHIIPRQGKEHLVPWEGAQHRSLCLQLLQEPSPSQPGLQPEECNLHMAAEITSSWGHGNEKTGFVLLASTYFKELIMEREGNVWCEGAEAESSGLG